MCMCGRVHEHKLVRARTRVHVRVHLECTRTGTHVYKRTRTGTYVLYTYLRNVYVRTRALVRLYVRTCVLVCACRLTSACGHVCLYVPTHINAQVQLYMLVRAHAHARVRLESRHWMFCCRNQVAHVTHAHSKIRIAHRVIRYTVIGRPQCCLRQFCWYYVIPFSELLRLSSDRSLHDEFLSWR